MYTCTTIDHLATLNYIGKLMLFVIISPIKFDPERNERELRTKDMKNVSAFILIRRKFETEQNC